MQYDFNDELRTALTHAMELEYAKYPDPDELDYEYRFSDEFEKKMKKICFIFIMLMAPLTIMFKRKYCNNRKS